MFSWLQLQLMRICCLCYSKSNFFWRKRVIASLTLGFKLFGDVTIIRTLSFEVFILLNERRHLKLFHSKDMNSHLLLNLKQSSCGESTMAQLIFLIIPMSLC